MARLNVNPTRMELKKLKARLSTAVRGHKLLKDKSDEMVRRFTVIIREDKRLREEVEQELSLTLKQFSVARSVTPAYRAETAFSMPSMAVNVECGTESIMGVEVPKRIIPWEWCPRCFRKWCCWRRRKRRCACWPTRSSATNAASTLWNTS